MKLHVELDKKFEEVKIVKKESIDEKQSKINSSLNLINKKFDSKNVNLTNNISNNENFILN